MKKAVLSFLMIFPMLEQSHEVEPPDSYVAGEKHGRERRRLRL